MESTTDKSVVSPVTEPRAVPLVDVETALNEHTTLTQKVAQLRQAEDPEETPFQSKYEANNLLRDYIEKLESYLPPHNTTSLTPELNTKLRDTIAELESVKGTIHIDTEDTSAGEISLVKALDHFESRFAACNGDYSIELLTHLIQVNNRLGILWNNREDRDKSEIYLKRAEQLYLDWKKGQNTDTIASLQSLQDEKSKEIESLYTHTIFFLAQLFRFQKKLTLVYK